MSRLVTCDKCGRERVLKEPWLPIFNAGLEIDLDLCKFCADELTEWVKR